MYTIRKSGDNFMLCFQGRAVECGLFATRKTANKYKAIAEYERRRGAQPKPGVTA